MSEARQLVLDGLLRRVAASDQAGSLVLRGGLLTRLWVGANRRRTDDADFLGLFARDAEEVARRLRAVLAARVEDEARFEVESLLVEMIWQETPFPGARALVQAEVAGTSHALQIDVGFGDPLVPPARLVEYPTAGGEVLRLLACRPETLVGWKLHGLFEHGARRWRAKDLHDLLLLTTHVPLEGPALAEAIAVAFRSRNQPLADVVPVVYEPAWWTTDKARQRWGKFRVEAPGAPEDVGEVARLVAQALRPALERWIALPAPI